MALHFFRISDGKYSGICDLDDTAGRSALWKEMIEVCADLLAGVSQDLQQNTEWKIELLDQHRKPVFCIVLSQKH